MKLPFLRKPEREEPLVVSMTGVRLGDRVLFVGSTPAFFGPLAARVGLSGQTTVIAPDAHALKERAERDGLLIDAATGIPADGSYDLAIVEARSGWADVLKSVAAAVRRGGRLIVIAGEPRGWLERVRGPGESPPSDAEIVQHLESAGWPSARSIGTHEELRFVESFRR